VKTLFVVFVSGALFTGCASGPVATSKADNVPSSRILTKKWLSPAPGTGRLIIKRDSGVTRAACDIRVYVSGTPVADLGPAEKVELFPPAGDHVVKGETRGICRGGTSEITMVISTQERRVVRIVSGKSEGIELRATFF
jgi:hypothetical protein